MHHTVIYHRFLGFDRFFWVVLAAGLAGLAARQLGASKLVQVAVGAAAAAISIAVAVLLMHD